MYAIVKFLQCCSGFGKTQNSSRNYNLAWNLASSLGINLLFLVLYYFSRHCFNVVSGLRRISRQWVGFLTVVWLRMIMFWSRGAVLGQRRGSLPLDSPFSSRHPVWPWKRLNLSSLTHLRSLGMEDSRLHKRSRNSMVGLRLDDSVFLPRGILALYPIWRHLFTTVSRAILLELCF